MYCKYCGKEIADDSKFCQHCGSKQDDATPKTNEPKKVIEVPTIKTNLSPKAKKWLGIYTIWATLNLIFVFIGKSNYSSNYLYPFDRSELRYYDFSEFLIYAVLLPSIVLVIYKWYQSKQKK